MLIRFSTDIKKMFKINFTKPIDTHSKKKDSDVKELPKTSMRKCVSGSEQAKAWNLKMKEAREKKRKERMEQAKENV